MYWPLKRKITFVLVCFSILGFGSYAYAKPHPSIPGIFLRDVPNRIYLKAPVDGTCRIHFASGPLQIDEEYSSGKGGYCVLEELSLPRAGYWEYVIDIEGERYEGKVYVIPGWVSLLPPLLAVLLAMIFRQVVLALVMGIWLGAAIVDGWNFFSGFLRVLDKYIVQSYANPDHVSIISFSLLLGGMVGIISKSGGTKGLVEVFSRMAKSSWGTQLATWIMGVVIFFDDYANTLFVGTTMRPLADRFRVSREKLSYLIDATAAPVANLAIISTWIGFEVSIIGDTFHRLGMNQEPYLTFLESIPYRFYPIFILVFSLFLILMHRDFGPMFHAEMRARTEAKVVSDNAVPLVDYESRDILPDEDATPKWIFAVAPIVVAIGVILIALFLTGYYNAKARGLIQAGQSPGIRGILAQADSYSSLMYGSAIGCLIAGILAMTPGTLSLKKVFDAWVGGMKAMFLAVIILGLAWAIGDVCQDVRTADFFIHFIGPHIEPVYIPALTTIISGAISFAIGSSWATMSIVMPLVIPLIVHRTAGLPPSDQWFFLIATISSVLAGATFGDHCSPISDTTILSSIFSGSDHIDHVRTQLPYAMTAGIVAILIGDYGTAVGLPLWLAYLLGLGILFGTVRFLGKKVPVYPSSALPAEGKGEG